MKTNIEKRVLLGFVLLFAGVALMLRFFDIIPFNIPYYFFSWKSLLVLLGIVFIISERNKTTGFVLFTIGSVFLLADIMHKNFWEVVQFVIPLALIVAGLAILLRKQSFQRKEINLPEGAEINDLINDVNIFGGGEKKVKSENFKGGQLTAIFGGSEIDLRASEMASGVNAIDILCIFGGASLKVPEGWHVKSEVTALFGGFSDERSKHSRELPSNPEKLLYLKGLVLFGGVEVKN
jgi:predicted membrane protein